MASDFSTYMDPNTPRYVFVFCQLDAKKLTSRSWKIFAYTYGGLVIASVPLMILGAAIGGAVPNIPSWSKGNDENSAGGVLAAMLRPAHGFGKFIVVLLAFSMLGNIAATMQVLDLTY